MNGKSRWCTINDVQEDLAALGGHLTEMDYDHILIGDRPPPIQRETVEDDEFLLRYGGTASLEDSYRVMKPDLEGIQRLLQMVKDNDSSSEDFSTDIVSISKLNPSVKEFVPKTAKTEETKEPLKLLTPDYFISNRRNESSTNIKCLDELLSDTSQSLSNPSTIDSTVQESIDKVNICFSGKTRRSVPSSVSPVLSLDQFAFKRKNGTDQSRASPETTVKPTASGTGNKYKPSKYANDLFQTYSERAEQRQTVKQDIWSTLEAQLKAKDEIIKKKMREQQNATSQS